MRVTIVTVNFNHLPGLKKTVVSVLNQTYLDLEYIIVDGGSTDGSAEYIKSLQTKKNVRFYWISERDSGTYDAMNKGIAMASGDYLLFMNSGDCFVSKNVLSEVFNRDWTADLIVGRQYQIRKGIKHSSHRILKNEINESFLISNTLPHQATFIRRDLLRRLGGYDLNYRIVADWVFWNEAILCSKATVECLDTFIAVMEREGLSSDIEKCRTEMASYLMDRREIKTIDDWKNVIVQNSYAYAYKCSTRTKMSSFLVRLAIWFSK